MDTYVVQSAELTTNGQGTQIWLVAMLKPDNGIHCHAFPPAAIEWRMAEYELDSVDEALDMVLHEPFAVDPMDPMQTRQDPAVEAGMTVRRPGSAVDEPIRLHNAPTIEQAREAHRVRIADAKKRIQVVAPKGRLDPLDTIRGQHGVTEVGLRQKTARVDAARRAVRGEPLVREPDIVFDPEARQRSAKENVSA